MYYMEDTMARNLVPTWISEVWNAGEENPARSKPGSSCDCNLGGDDHGNSLAIPTAALPHRAGESR